MSSSSTGQAGDRVLNSVLAQRVMSGEEAAALIQPGAQIGMSGFTGSGYPKAVPMALARRITDAHLRGQKFKVNVFTGASTGPELDGALAMVGGMQLRLPYQSDPITRKLINSGEMQYIDMHLSQVGQIVEYGFLGKLDLALIEVTAVLEDGRVIPSTSVGNNLAWIECAEKVILEVNSAQPMALEGMHDLYSLGKPPHRDPIPLTSVCMRIGEPYLKIPMEKVIAVVRTDTPDRSSEFKPPDENSKRIAAHIMEFLGLEVKKGRLPATLLPLQSGVGNIANAVLYGLEEGPFDGLTAYTEVIQDGLVKLLRSGKMTCASATAFSLSPEGTADFIPKIGEFRDRIVLRPQEISNHPGIIRRLGVIAMNAMIEADIYGNVNSTHIMGSSIMNGIGGLGRLRTQRVPVDLHGAVDGAEGDDLDDRADGVARGPHGARRFGGGDGAGAGRPARAVADAAGQAGDREVLAPGLSRGAAGLLQPLEPAVERQAHAAFIDGEPELAQPVSAHRAYAKAGGVERR